MSRLPIFGALALMLMTVGNAEAGTLSDIRARDILNCGVSTGINGFSAPDSNGVWQGFDVAFCRAVAAVTLNDPLKVHYVPLNGPERFAALTAGEIDLLSRNSTWNFTRDVGLQLTFVGVTYYDGQGFLVRKDRGVSSAKELDGAKICIQTGTTTEANLVEFFRTNNITYHPVAVATSTDAQQRYLAGDCDTYTTDVSGLAATRAGFTDPDNHVILPEMISKEPLGPAVRQGDGQWADLVRWTLHALIAAEEYGITSANIDEMAKSTENPQVNRILGTTGNFGTMLGVDDQWAVRAIKAGGNYGEIFAANIGDATPIGLARGLNALWTQGGLMYSPPFN